MINLKKSLELNIRELLRVVSKGKKKSTHILRQNVTLQDFFGDYNSTSKKEFSPNELLKQIEKGIC